MSDPVPIDPDVLAEASQRLVRTVDAFTDDDFRAPSLLPDWDRAHVVAHVALNAEGLAGVLTGLRRGEPAAMYASSEARDTDIEALAGAEPTELRERLLASTTLFDQALRAMSSEDWDGRFERTPGGPSFASVNIGLMRVREVEIHHADLGADYSAADWPATFTCLVLDSMTKRPYPRPFRVLARDLAQTWEYGDGDPVATVTGESHDLAWWLTGRADGGTLTVDRDELPEVPAW